MYTVKIFGAGSIGNHLAFASRSKGWRVTMADLDPAALERTRNEIYPARYGAWDDDIGLKDVGEAMDDAADIVFIGTPPDVHIPLALEVLECAAPRALVIEKPLCGPDLGGCQTLLERAEAADVFVGVGYNHTLGRNTRLAEEILAERDIGTIQTLSAKTREHWGGIFKAHPWLSGPEDTYLGYYARGGGASGEHSHAINIWQHFAHLVGAGRVVEVGAMMDIVKDGAAEYDRLSLLSLRTSEGLVGDVVQDVVTAPTEKSARVQGTNGFVEWHVNYRPDADAVIAGSDGGEPETTLIEKTRPDDFKVEVDHLEQVLGGQIKQSAIALRRGLDTMMVIAAAFESHETGRRVGIDWDGGYTPDSIR
jgi:predicted dehydrogenase